MSREEQNVHRVLQDYGKLHFQIRNEETGRFGQNYSCHNALKFGALCIAKSESQQFLAAWILTAPVLISIVCLSYIPLDGSFISNNIDVFVTSIAFVCDLNRGLMSG